MKKSLLVLGFILVSSAFLLLLSACEIFSTESNDESETPTYSITFMVGDEEVFKYYVLRNSTADPILVDAPEGYYFSAWLLDNRAYSFNTPVRSNIVLTAAFAASDYHIYFYCGDICVSTQTFNINTMDEIEIPTLTPKQGYYASWEDFTVGLSDITVNVVYTPIVYQAKFYCGDILVDTVDYTVETTELVEPEIVPQPNQVGYWENYTLDIGGISVHAIYTASENSVSFYADDVLVSSVPYTMESGITEPKVPFKAGYVGVWEDYELDGESIRVDAVYTPIEYSVTFKDGENVVEVCTYTVEDMHISPPKPPIKSGFVCSWSEYELNCTDITVFAVYEIIEFTASFYADNQLVEAVKFTFETESLTEPEIPQKTGYTAAWENYTLSANDIKIEAIYTEIVENFTVVFMDGENEISKQIVTDKTKITFPALPTKSGYSSSWTLSETGYKLVYNAKYTPIEYTASFYADNQLIEAVKFTFETESLTEPEIPQKTGYTAAWENYTLNANDIRINAIYTEIVNTYSVLFLDGENEISKQIVTDKTKITFPNLPSKSGYSSSWVLTENNNYLVYASCYTPIEYTASFYVDNQLVEAVKFTVETEKLTEPEIPQKTGYTAVWESYTLNANDIRINAIYTEIVNTYSVLFMDGENEISKQVVTDKTKITFPALPTKSGYSSSWVLTENGNNIVYNAKYTPIEYTASFYADNQLVEAVKFTVETDSLTEPEIPQKTGYTAVWESYTLTANDIRINAIYTEIINTYSVLFMDGENEISKQIVIDKTKITFPTLPTKSGYSSSWALTENGNNLVYASCYTPIEYTASFYADNQLVEAVKFTVETESLNEPEIPQKTGYTAAWESYTLNANDIVINAIYTEIVNTYSVLFMDGDKQISKQIVTDKTKITFPNLPSKSGYSSSWVLTENNNYLVYASCYTPIEYTASFYADNQLVETIIFTVETEKLTEPEIPQKTGYTAVWENYTLNANDIRINAIYTEIVQSFTVVFMDGENEISKQIVTDKTKITFPTLPAKIGYSSSWTLTENDNNLVYNTKYLPIEYTASFYADNQLVETIIFTVETEKLTEPEIPQKTGYTAAWENYTLSANDIKIEAIYTEIVENFTVVFMDGENEISKQIVTDKTKITFPNLPTKIGYSSSWVLTEIGYNLVYASCYSPIEYTASFYADNQLVEAVKFTVETGSLSEPEIPQKTGYTAAWESYTLTANDIRINAIYTEIVNTYSVLFMDGENEISKQVVTDKTKITFPTLPTKSGYSSSWVLTENDNNLVYNTKYTTIEYTASFYADNQLVEAVKFTVETESLSEPEIPQKSGYTATWESYTLNANDIRINAIYTLQFTDTSCFEFVEVDGGYSIKSLKDTNLTSVVVPETFNDKPVVSISRIAFYKTAITSIVLPKTLLSIEKQAFYGTEIVEIVIPDSVTTIGVGAFYYCKQLKKVVIGSGVERIDKNAFKGCDELKIIELCDSQNWFSTADEITFSELDFSDMIATVKIFLYQDSTIFIKKQ